MTASSRTVVFRGTVERGLGDASRWMRLLAEDYRVLTGEELVPGTLNVRLAVEWRSPATALVLAADPSRGTVEVLVTPCRIDGHPGFVIRTAANEAGHGDHPRQVVEIASAVHFRSALGLVDGDVVAVELPVEMSD